MTMYDYIILNNSNSSLTKKFRVLREGFEDKREKLGQRRVTVTGKVDNQVGPARRSWRMRLKVYETDPTDPSKADGATEGYGILSHLRTFYGYDDPGGTPTNVIAFTDHVGTSHYVYLVDGLVEEMLTPVMEGVNAAFSIQVTMEETTAL